MNLTASGLVNVENWFKHLALILNLSQLMGLWDVGFLILRQKSFLADTAMYRLNFVGSLPLVFPFGQPNLFAC